MSDATRNQKKAVHNFCGRNGCHWAAECLRSTVADGTRVDEFLADPYHFIEEEMSRAEASNWIEAMIDKIVDQKDDSRDY